MSIKTQHIRGILIKEGREPRHMSIWLAINTEGGAFHCPNCGRFQFNHKHRIIAILESGMTNKLVSPPIELQCQKCGCLLDIHIM